MSRGIDPRLPTVEREAARVDLTIIKNPDGQGWNRAWLARDDGTAVAIEVSTHDFAHLVFESHLQIEHGFWGLLARGAFPNSRRLTGVRNRRRARMSAKLTPIPDPVTAAHRDELGFAESMAIEVTRSDRNASAIRRIVHEQLPAFEGFVSHLDEESLALMRRSLRELIAAWRDLAPGERFRLTWPLEVAQPEPGAVADRRRR